MNHLHFKKCITILLLVASTYSHSQNKVGIGTENPEGFLHIYGNSTGGTLPHALIEQSTSDFTRLGFRNTSTANLWTIGGRPSATNNLAKFSFYYDGIANNVMVLQGDGRVGIGAFNPSGMLHIYGNSTDGTLPHALIEQSTAGYTRLAFKNSTTSNAWTIGGLPSSTNANARFTVYYDGLGRDVITMTGDGKVGIGTSTEINNTLVVESAPSLTGQLEVRNSNYISSGSTTAILFRYDVVGSPWLLKAAHTISGPVIRFHTLQTSQVLNIYESGDALLAGALTQNSDSRLKRDITPLTGSLNSIMQLSGYTYYWNQTHRSKSQQIGVIAQELEKIYPQLVRKDDEGTLSDNYSGLVPVLIEAVKEQQTQIKNQEAHNKSLQEEIRSMRAELQAVKEGLKK